MTFDEASRPEADTSDESSSEEDDDSSESNDQSEDSDDTEHLSPSLPDLPHKNQGINSGGGNVDDIFSPTNIILRGPSRSKKKYMRERVDQISGSPSELNNPTPGEEWFEHEVQSQHQT